jgi:hypothetical protein
MTTPTTTRVKATKTVKPVITPTPVETTPVVTPVVTPVKKTKKAVTVTLPEVIELVVEPTLETETPVSVTSETIIKSLDETFKIIQNATKEFNTLMKELKSVRQKEIRQNNKKTKKSKRTLSSEPHGFAKKTQLHPTLLNFLGLEPETELSSPTVTSMIAKYIKANNLGLENNKSIFKCDEKLFSILGEPTFVAVKKTPELGINHSYWNLQKTLKKQGMFLRPV